MERKVAVSRSVSNLQKSLAHVKDVLEYQKWQRIAWCVMNCLVQVIILSLVVAGLAGDSAAQKQTPAKATSPNKQASPHAFGESYATLLPEQKRLLVDFVRRYDQTTGTKLDPEQLYNGARVSVRTTFDAVTHALLSTKLTNEKGQSLGLAIDLVEALEQVLGEEAGAGGDRQFRMYVYLGEVREGKSFSAD